MAAPLDWHDERSVFTVCLPDVSFHSCLPRRRFMSPDEVLVSLTGLIFDEPHTAPSAMGHFQCAAVQFVPTLEW